MNGIYYVSGEYILKSPGQIKIIPPMIRMRSHVYLVGTESRSGQTREIKAKLTQAEFFKMMANAEREGDFNNTSTREDI